MGWMHLMSSKVGYLLSHSPGRTNPGSYGHCHTDGIDGGHSFEVNNMGLEREQDHYHLRRALSENNAREEFLGPDTSSLSAFLYSFFSSSEAEVQCGGDELIGQRSEEEKYETVACCNPKSSLASNLFQLAASTSDKALQKGAFDDEAEDNSLDCGIYGEDLEEADWLMVSKDEVGHLESQARNQEPSNCSVLTPPSMSEASLLLSAPLCKSLLPALPTLVLDRQWTLLYSTWRHGISLLTLYRRSSILPGPYLLVIGDAKGATFGGLLSGPLRPTPKKKYQGTSETFVFSDISGEVKRYRPTGANRYFVLCASDALAFGGGGHFALHLDGDLLTGSSGSCATFGNMPLAHSEYFDVKHVELWGFAHSSKYVPRSLSYREPTEAPGVCRW